MCVKDLRLELVAVMRVIWDATSHLARWFTAIFPSFVKRGIILLRGFWKDLCQVSVFFKGMFLESVSNGIATLIMSFYFHIIERLQSSNRTLNIYFYLMQRQYPWPLEEGLCPKAHHLEELKYYQPVSEICFPALFENWSKVFVLLSSSTLYY